MSISVAITAEGVLRQIIGGAPISEGRRLYQALSSIYRIIVLTDDPYGDELAGWLNVEAFGPSPLWVIPRLETYGEDGPSVRRQQLAQAQQRGAVISAVIDPDPAICAYLLTQGFLTLCALHPAYAQPEWRPDHDSAIKPWDEIEAAVDRQRELRSKDRRILEET